MIMDNIFGEARGQLIHANEEERLTDATADQNLDLVNRYTQKPLTRDQINIKSMWLCNDIIDSYYSRFNDKTLSQLAEKAPGASVLIAHDTSTLPIGKFFKAAVFRREDSHQWLRAWFYWPKDMDHSDNLLKGIESGLYSEVSVSWNMTGAICSICGKDMRGFECPHIPGKTYPDSNGTEQLCYWESEDIETFNEGSLVYKGGQYGTSITDERKKMIAERNAIIDKKEVTIHEEIRSKEIVNQIIETTIDAIPKGKYNICPNYDCQTIRIVDNKIFINDIDCSNRLYTIAGELKDNIGTFNGYIFKKRGNSRLNRNIFQQWLDSNVADDHTITIKLFDPEGIFVNRQHVQSIKFISPDKISPELARTVASKDGCIVYDDKIKYIVKEISNEQSSNNSRNDNKEPESEPVSEPIKPDIKPEEQNDVDIEKLSDQDCEQMIDEDSDEERAKWTGKKKKGLPDAAFCPSLIKTVDGKKIRKCPHHNANVKNANEASSLDQAHLTAALRLVGRVQGFSAADIAKAKAHLEMHQSQLKDRSAENIYRTFDGDKQFYQFKIEDRWYKVPTSVSAGMIFKEVETLDSTRSMLLGPIETSIDSGVLTIESKFISGKFRTNTVTLNGQKLKVVKLITNNLQ